MIKTTYQTPELRDANDNVVQEGSFGKNTALSNSTNDGWIDYVMNDLEALHDTIGDSAPTLDGNGHVVEPANLAIGDEDGIRFKTGYLKTSGGTVSGTLNVAQNLKMQDNQENVFGGFYVPASSATSQFLQLYGGETPSSNGGNLQLPSDGSWTLQAKNGTTAYNLVGGTDGTLKWHGNNLAYDSDCVHLAGTETISGQKTFTSKILIARGTGNNGKKIHVRFTPLTKGEAPTTTLYDTIIDETDANDARVGLLEHTFYTSGSHDFGLRLYDHVTDSGNSTSLLIGQNADGSFFAKTRTPTQNSNTNEIATTEWVNNKTANYLPLTGGTLTRSVLVETNASSANFGVVRTDIEKGTAPSVTKYSDMSVLWASDTASNNRLAIIEHTYNTDNSAFLSFRIYKNQAGSSASTAFSIGQRSDLSYYSSVNADLSPTYDGSYNLGSANYRWKQLFASTTTISTSDERLKDNITAVPDEVLDAWGEVNWYQYQFKDSIEEKGKSKARLHTGAIAQRIESVFSAHGLDANRYGLLCYDEWKAESAQRDRDGNIVLPTCPAGNRYSLRYEEALCMEAAYQRRRADRLEERIARLEALIEAQNEQIV